MLCVLGNWRDLQPQGAQTKGAVAPIQPASSCPEQPSMVHLPCCTAVTQPGGTRRKAQSKSGGIQGKRHTGVHAGIMAQVDGKEGAEKWRRARRTAAAHSPRKQELATAPPYLASRRTFPAPLRPHALWQLRLSNVIHSLPTVAHGAQHPSCPLALLTGCLSLGMFHVWDTFLGFYDQLLLEGIETSPQPAQTTLRVALLPCPCPGWQSSGVVQRFGATPSAIRAVCE